MKERSLGWNKEEIVTRSFAVGLLFIDARFNELLQFFYTGRVELRFAIDFQAGKWTGPVEVSDAVAFAIDDGKGDTGDASISRRLRTIIQKYIRTANWIWGEILFYKEIV